MPIITSQSVIKDYQAMRAATKHKLESLENSAITGRGLDIIRADIDEDPLTEDQIVAAFWNGDFSADSARLEFTERHVEGRQVLEFTAEQPKTFASKEIDSSTALLDLQTGAVLSSSGTGAYFMGEVYAPGFLAQ